MLCENTINTLTGSMILVRRVLEFCSIHRISMDVFLSENGKRLDVDNLQFENDEYFDHV